MKDPSEFDAGTLAALMKRFRESRLPRTKRLLKKVNEGRKLDDHDIQFLKRVYKDSRNTQGLVKRHPEYHELISRYIDMYTEIVAKGVELEKN